MPAISSQVTVTTAGSAVALGSQTINGPIMVKALTDNTGYIYIGNDGSNDVSDNNGLHLAADDVVVLDFVGNLASIYIDCEVDGEGVAWLALNV